LHYDNAAEAASVAGGGDQIRQSARVTMEHQAVSNIAEETGDFPATLAQYDQQLNEPDFVGSRWSAVYMKAADLAKLHDVTASRHALGGYEDAGIFLRTGTGSGWNQTNFDLPQFEQFAALDDWAGAHKDIALVFSAPPTGGGTQFRVNAMPLLALAQAKTGDIKAAWATIGKLPLDCYLCLRVRGQIAGVQRNWSEADRWFARAVRFAPSIPFAYTEWGATLLSRGRYDVAIVKFKEANAKGPHFADPFEMWGEALTRENRSDLALAKFAEAVKYAPHWGRLHLKWGEALFYAEQKNEAKKQFAIAATLDLSQAEKSELARAPR
jgi:tetratricopeptide (TPR) repeat protein